MPDIRVGEVLFIIQLVTSEWTLRTVNEMILLSTVFWEAQMTTGWQVWSSLLKSFYMPYSFSICTTLYSRLDEYWRFENLNMRARLEDIAITDIKGINDNSFKYACITAECSLLKISWWWLASWVLIALYTNGVGAFCWFVIIVSWSLVLAPVCLNKYWSASWRHLSQVPCCLQIYSVTQIMLSFPVYVN